jgi:voltage-gated potassium channel
MTWKERVHELLESPVEGDRLRRIFDIFIVSLISLNVAAIVAQTVPGARGVFGPWFFRFEVFSIASFTVEYVLRVWSCVVSPNFRHPVTGRLRFMASPLAVIDLVAVLPFYLPFMGVDLRFVRAVRLFRILRVLKLGRYWKSLRLIGSVIVEKRAELIMTLALSVLLVVLSSSLMYSLEHDRQPEKFSSIPRTMWWAVATLATIGYGDMYPMTALGQFFGAVISMLGIGMFALPTAILGSGFLEAFQKQRTRVETCPHCGKSLTHRTQVPEGETQPGA